MRPRIPYFCTFFIGLLTLFVSYAGAYYKRYQCYGGGHCLIAAHGGGHVDDQHRWAIECHDGEALVGIMDYSDHISWSEFWCTFMFPKKKPTNGLYPYYEYCNVRDVTVMREYYCYDKYFPQDTYDTFITAFAIGQYFPRSGGTNAELYKCCRTPSGYHLDYSRCEYKYSHDKYGEHYNENNMFACKCDRDFVMTGMGKAENPWDGALHYTWIQCCPLFFNPSYVTLIDTASQDLYLLGKTQGNYRNNTAYYGNYTAYYGNSSRYSSSG